MARVTATDEPILATWKVSDVLGRYPELLDTLVGLSPAFRHLRNPIVRRVQARLVTVAQAARIAGLAPADVVRRLNGAAGLSRPDLAPEMADERPSAHETDPPPWVGSAPVAAEVDARALQASGGEPFGAIVTAARQVLPGQVLRLRSAFEPLPLYDVLGRRGFVPWSRQLGPDDWEVLLLNAGAPGSPAPASAPTKPRSAEAARPSVPDAAVTATVTIDVSDLVPPEPMIRIMEALEALAPGEVLLVHHVRRPLHLYPRLDELGYHHETRELGPSQIELRIQKPAEPEVSP